MCGNNECGVADENEIKIRPLHPNYNNPKWYNMVLRQMALFVGSTVLRGLCCRTHDRYTINELREGLKFSYDCSRGGNNSNKPNVSMGCTVTGARSSTILQIRTLVTK